MSQGFTTSPPFVDNFRRVVQNLNDSVSLFGESGDVPAVPTSMSGMRNEVEKNVNYLPDVYQKSYAKPLLANWDNVLRGIGGELVFAETLCAPVYQHNPSTSSHPSLHRFQIIVTDLYDHFLRSSKRHKLNLPIIEKLAPLAMFQKSGVYGPFTIPADATKQLFGADVAVVSLPGNYMKHPVIWAAVSHEVGGHDVLHADSGLIQELGDLLLEELPKKGVPGEICDVWKYWTDEATSDVYGVLNYGPMFVMNLAFFFSVLNIQAGGKDWMRTTTYRDMKGELDPHPTDLLRLSLARGVIMNLTELSSEKIKSFIEELDSLTVFLTAGRKSITLQGLGDFDLSKMQEWAELVGNLICQLKLKKLAGKSIVDIVMWKEKDEKIVEEIRRQLNEETIGKIGHPFQETNHVLSAATSILMSRAERYDEITKATEELLDQCAEKNKLWRSKIISRRIVYVRPTEKGKEKEAGREDEKSSKKQPLFSFW